MTRVTNIAPAALLALACGCGPITAQQLEVNKDERNSLFVGAGRLSGIYTFYSYDFGKTVLGATYYRNPTDGSTEYQLGVGYDLDRGTYGFWPFFGMSKATESWYVQPWVYAWWEKGRVVTYGYLGTYFPMQSNGAFQFFVDSATALYKFKDRFGAGASYSMGYTAGTSAVHGIGPAVQVGLGNMTATVEFLKGSRNYGDEVRVTFQRSF